MCTLAMTKKSVNIFSAHVLYQSRYIITGYRFLYEIRDKLIKQTRT